MLFRASRLIDEFSLFEPDECLLMRNRAGENVTLNVACAARLDEFKLVVRFRAFRDCFHLESFGQANNRADDRGVLISFLGGSAHEALIDLDLVERSVAQVTHRGVTSAEVV